MLIRYPQLKNQNVMDGHTCIDNMKTVYLHLPPLPHRSPPPPPTPHPKHTQPHTNTVCWRYNKLSKFYLFTVDPFSEAWCAGKPRWLSWISHPTEDQEVAGSAPTEVGNILSWRLIMKYFLRSLSPFCWFKKGSCQFLVKECAQYGLTA